MNQIPGERLGHGWFLVDAAYIFEFRFWAEVSVWLCNCIVPPIPVAPFQGHGEFLGLDSQGDALGCNISPLRGSVVFAVALHGKIPKQYWTTSFNFYFAHHRPIPCLTTPPPIAPLVARKPCKSPAKLTHSRRSPF